MRFWPFWYHHICFHYGYLWPLYVYVYILYAYTRIYIYMYGLILLSPSLADFHREHIDILLSKCLVLFKSSNARCSRRVPLTPGAFSVQANIEPAQTSLPLPSFRRSYPSSQILTCNIHYFAYRSHECTLPVGTSRRRSCGELGWVRVNDSAGYALCVPCPRSFLQGNRERKGYIWVDW